MSSAEQERQIEQILEGFGDGFCAFDHDWRITYCNRAAQTQAGISRAQAQGRIVWEAIPALAGGALEAACRRAKEQQAEVRFEAPSVLRPDLFLAFRVFPIDGGLAVTFGDVTERRRREQREREQALHLELALAASGLGDWSWDAATDQVTLSDRAAAIFGMAPGVVLTWSQILTRVNSQDVARATGAAEAAVAGRTEYEVEYRVTPRIGEAEVWLTLRAQPHYAEDGTPLGLRGVVGDITRRKAQEAELRESEARFRAMANSAPAPVWVTSADGPIEFVNEAFAEYAGKPADQLTGSGVWFELLHPEDIVDVQRERAKAIEGPHPWSIESRVRHASGEWRWMRTTSRPRFDAAGRFEGYVGLGIDVTDIRAAEERQQLLINELNHRVKNTLATVQSIARQTLRDGVSGRVARAHFTDRLLALSTAHNVLTRENWESAELADIAAEAVRPYDDPETPRITLEGPPARVAPSVAVALSMAFHELATIATKSGALSVAAGRVALVWTLCADGRGVDIVWRETGGPPVTPPKEKGFGSRLLGQGLTAEIGRAARLAYDPDGLVCTLTAPTAEA